LIVNGSGNGYLRAVCDYVHLNPARAKLLQQEGHRRKMQMARDPDKPVALPVIQLAAPSDAGAAVLSQVK
jgi:hypothetical protein